MIYIYIQCAPSLTMYKLFPKLRKLIFYFGNDMKLNILKRITKHQGNYFDDENVFQAS